MTDEQKLRYKELNRKTAAAICLKKKQAENIVKEKIESGNRNLDF